MSNRIILRAQVVHLIKLQNHVIKLQNRLAKVGYTVRAIQERKLHHTSKLLLKGEEGWGNLSTRSRRAKACNHKNPVSDRIAGRQEGQYKAGPSSHQQSGAQAMPSWCPHEIPLLLH
jgi:hypothetical protein